MASSSAVSSVPSSFSSSSSRHFHHFILRGAAPPLPSIQNISSALPLESEVRNEEKRENVRPMALNRRSQFSTESSDGRKETRAPIDPAEFFARQSMNASRMARRTNTRHRFQQQNALFEDLLLAEEERDAVPTALTIRGTTTAAEKRYANAEE